MSISTIHESRPWPYGLKRRDTSRAPAGALAGLARLLATALWEYRARRAARHLMALDDRLLGDMGLDRDGIELAVRVGRE